MNHRERIQACITGGNIDRVPVALWRHFPVDDQDPNLLAEATIEFQQLYDFDLVKVTPASSYCLKDWGVMDVWQGSTEGTREYVTRVIEEPDGWYRLKTLDADFGYLAEQIKCVKTIINAIGHEVPIIQTIFSPLAQAKNLVGFENLLVHLRMYPEALQEGLKTIAESTSLFVDALAGIGVDGIFYAVQHAQFHVLSLQEYEEFGKCYDLEILERANGLWLNMLHLHGENIMFDLFTEYPVSVLNWHDRDTSPTLSDGLDRFPGIVCGGLQREKSIVFGSPQQIKDEAIEAISSVEGNRLILGTGCVIPIIAPRGNISAVRRSVDFQ